ISTLLSMGGEDELDRLLKKEMEVPPPAIPTMSIKEHPPGEDRRRHKRIPPNWVALITFLGEEGKTFSEVEAFLRSGGATMSPGAARTGLMNYRREFGFVENPRKGFYKATRKGLDVVESQQKES